MQIKLFEILDRATCMPVMVVKLQDTSAARYPLLSRAGFNPFGEPVCYMFVTLAHPKANWDAYGWPAGDRTCSSAHKYIEQHFDELPDGAVVDVQYILGETQTPRPSDVHGVTTAPIPEHHHVTTSRLPDQTLFIHGEKYEYEMFFKSEPNDFLKIDGWYPIATDRIKHPEKIEEYIQKGLLRRISGS